MNQLEQATQALNKDIDSGKYSNSESNQQQGIQKETGMNFQDHLEAAGEQITKAQRDKLDSRDNHSKKSDKENSRNSQNDESDDVEADRMRQRDYTKKTQALAEEKRRLEAEKAKLEKIQKMQEYYDNLDADIEAVERDPSLIGEFKKIYPPEFHRYVDRLARAYGWNNQQSRSQSANGEMTREELYARLSPEDRAAIDRVRAVDEHLQQERVRAADLELQNIQQSFSQKYPEAPELMVLAKAQILNEKKMKETGQPLNRKEWEFLYKSTHDEMIERYDKRGMDRVNKVREANLQARGPGPGGGIPGQASTRRTLKDAESDLFRDFPVKNR